MSARFWQNYWPRVRLEPIINICQVALHISNGLHWQRGMTMVDSKFLVVTTLCYVGIFAVIFIVCCCAWTRHLRKEGRGYSSRLRNNTNRRLHRPQPPPEYPVTPNTPLYAQRGNEFVEETFPVGNTYFPAAQIPHNVQRNNLYPMASHYPMFVHPRGNLFPTSVTTDVDITLEVNSMTCGETSQGAFSGEDFSDATSSRFDGGDSAFAETTEEKRQDPTPRTISPSVDNGQNETASDDASEVCQFKEVTL